MKVLVFDTECTSLLSKTGDNDNFHILQLSYIVYDTITKVSEETDFILKSPVKILNSDIHGITDEMSAMGYDFSEIVNIFLEDVENVDLIIAHNLNFDLNALELELYRLEMDDDIDKLFEKPFYCTMKMGIGVISPRYPKLCDLYFYYFNKKFENAHNAIFDVRATIACYLKLTENEVLLC